MHELFVPSTPGFSPTPTELIPRPQYTAYILLYISLKAAFITQLFTAVIFLLDTAIKVEISR